MPDTSELEDVLAEWTVFKVGSSCGKLRLDEVATVRATAEDDALVSAAERHALKGKHVAISADVATGRTLALRYLATLED